MIRITMMPTLPETVYPLLKHDEEIVCTDAIVSVDSRGEVTWWDKHKMLMIFGTEDEEETK